MSGFRRPVDLLSLLCSVDNLTFVSVIDHFSISSVTHHLDLKGLPRSLSSICLNTLQVDPMLPSPLSPDRSLGIGLSYLADAGVTSPHLKARENGGFLTRLLANASLHCKPSLLGVPLG